MLCVYSPKLIILEAKLCHKGKKTAQHSPVRWLQSALFQCVFAQVKLSGLQLLLNVFHIQFFVCASARDLQIVVIKQSYQLMKLKYHNAVLTKICAD